MYKYNLVEKFCFNDLSFSLKGKESKIAIKNDYTRKVSTINKKRYPCKGNTFHFSLVEVYMNIYDLSQQSAKCRLKLVSFRYKHSHFI